MKDIIFPKKLTAGSHIRVVAPSCSLSLIAAENRKLSNERLGKMGFNISFGDHVEESDGFTSSSIESRVSDLHAAFSDDTVDAVLPVIGGFNCNQLLRYLDWELLRAHPKILLGYSDTTALQNALFAKTSVVAYSGPAWSTFAQKLHFEYTLEYFKKCVMEKDPFVV